MRTLLLLGLVACGDNHPAMPDAASLPIQVHVELADQTPAPGIDIVFHDDAGDVVSFARTGTDGAVETDDPAVSMVTMLAVDPDDGKRTAWTKTGLAGGDTAWFTLFYGGTDQPPPTFMAPVSIAVPPNPPGGATTFSIDFGCEGTSGAATMLSYTMLNDCRRPGTNELDAVVLAMNGTTVTGYSFMKAVPIVTSGTTQFDFPSGWHTDPLQIVAQYANPPAGLTQARMSFQGYVDANPFYPFVSQLATVPPGPSRSYTVARGFYTTLEHSIELDYGGKGWALLGERATAPMTNSVTMFDLGGLALPDITAVTLAEATSVRPTITWTQSGTHAAAAGGFAGVSWSGGRWSFQIPPDDATSVRIPALPAEYAAFQPPTDGSVTDPYIQFQRYSYAPTYADFIAEHGDVPDGEYRFVITRFPSFF